MNDPVVELHALSPARGSRTMRGWWPSRQHFELCGRCSAVVALVFGLVYGGADAIARLHTHRVSSYIWLDDSVPFVPQATLVYSSLWAMFALTPFAIRDAGGLRMVSRVMCVEILVAGVFFLAAPMPDRQPAVEAGSLGLAFRAADFVNLEFNQFPSLHAAFGFTLGWVFSRGARGAVRAALLAWSAAIGVAAVLTWQHAILDVIGGGVLTVAAVALAGRLPPIGAPATASHARRPRRSQRSRCGFAVLLADRPYNPPSSSLIS